MRKAAPIVALSCLVLFFTVHLVNLFSQSDTTRWPPPGFEERVDERNEMVDDQIAVRGVRSDKVLDAMRSVPRHLFVPKSQRSNAYRDRPLPIGHGQTISQPYIVAYMTEILNLSSDDKVLEIGTGSGYQSAVLSEITPHVYTIEIIEALGRQAKERYEKLGYDSIRVKIADGYFGWKEYAPFDAIIVTAAAGHVPPPLLKQLKPDGVMMIPVGSPYLTQTLMKVTKSESGEMRTQNLMPVRFVPMTGEALKE
ncbi:MAG: Protein-L-isoaspartate O-methyltransferase [Candidatus Marinimicrobia bacterium]|nr:Protein-L-isoaspartate O-methyltransferase [Candidatus Neomarinimicrobiota bacterium]